MRILTFRHILGIITLASFSTASHSASTVLSEVYGHAVEQDPSIKAARYAAEAGHEKATQGKSLMLPRVNASANLAYNYNKSSFSGGNIPDSSNNYDSRSMSLNVVQPLYNKANKADYNQGILFSEQSELTLKLAEQDLMLRVADAYFNVLSAKESVGVTLAQKRAFAESLERAKLTFEIGTATITDKLEAQARYDLAIADEIAAQNALEVARQSLRSITNTVYDGLAPLRDGGQLPELNPRDMEEWVNIALSNSLEVQNASKGLLLSQQGLEKARGNRHPTLNLVGTASNSRQYSPFVSADNTNTNLSIALQLDYPLYTGGNTSSVIREAVASSEQARESVEQARRLVSLQTKQQYLAALNGWLRVDALNKALLSSESALEATRKGVEVGVRTNLDLLNAQQQFFGTKRDLTVAKYEYLLSLLRLKSAAGTLNEQDLESMSALLQP